MVQTAEKNMKRLHEVSLIAVSLCISASALAENTCAKQPSDGALFQCTVQQKKLAEDDLNKEYQTAKKRIVQMYGTQKKLADDYVATLVDTQRNWLKYVMVSASWKPLPLKKAAMRMRLPPTSVLSASTKNALLF